MAGALIERFRATASAQPSAPAFTFADGRQESYTFAELFDQCEDLARRFAALELPADGPVGILLRRQEDQVIHYLGLLCAGLVPAVLTPPNPKLNRRYYAETMASVLERSRLSAVVTDVELEISSPTFGPHDLKPLNRRSPGVAVGPPLEAAFVQFSSGTTGIKRGVLVRDEAALAQIDTYGAAIDLASHDTIVSWLPLYHDMGFIACLNMPLARGAHTVMMDPIKWVTNPSLLLRRASDHHATLAWNPNFAYSFMAQRVRDRDIEGVDLSSIRGLVNCSEPVTHASQEQFSTRFRAYGLRDGVFWGCYAMAETTFALTHSNSPEVDPFGPGAGAASNGAARVSVGRALPGVELRIVSESGDLLPDGHLGEIQVRSPFAFSGYFNDPEATTAAHVDGWYRTVDLGYRIGAALYVVDRKKDVMIVNGVNVFPLDLEQVVSSLDGVVPGRVVAFSEFDTKLQSERVVVLFESSLSRSELRRTVDVEVRARILAAFQIANFEVYSVPPGWLVKSSAGKISRAQNRRKWNQEESADTAKVAVR